LRSIPASLPQRTTKKNLTSITEADSQIAFSSGEGGPLAVDEESSFIYTCGSDEEYNFFLDLEYYET